MAVYQARRPMPVLARRAPPSVGRSLNVAISLAALVVFLPLMIVIATLIAVTSRGPVLFGHKRIGLGGRSFRCLKFRTMIVGAEDRLPALLAADPAAMREWKLTHKLQNDPRITWIGHFLRRSSLDELPQIFNVIAGDMSWVGPRPIVEEEVSRYGRRFFSYCRVRPGITGLWQVSGRSSVSYRRRVALDTSYVRCKCLRLDAAILLLTVPRVLLGRGSF